MVVGLSVAVGASVVGKTGAATGAEESVVVELTSARIGARIGIGDGDGGTPTGAGAEA